MIKSIDSLLRDNIRELKPYSSARNEYSEGNAIFMDANENPYETGFNRYPDPLQRELKSKIADLKNVDIKHLFLGNGSDEPIDLLFRAFCVPGKDNVIAMQPSYGMYQVCADINDIEVKNVLLKEDFQLNVEAMLEASGDHTKLLFLCSPNNPTGNVLNPDDIIKLLQDFNGLVVVDEAYIDFSNAQSLIPEINHYNNLVVLQTFSKAWGLAGIRLGMAFADNQIISILNKIKYPYNINRLTQNKAYEFLDNIHEKDEWITRIIEERERLNNLFEDMEEVIEILPSETNFLMVKVKHPAQLYNYLVKEKVIVRDRSKVPLCDGCLRITIGLKEENDKLIQLMQSFNV